MELEEKSKHSLKKSLLKLSLYLLKIIPIVLSIIALVATLLDTFGMEAVILNYIMFFVMYLFLYIASYMFNFCEYHRVFLHYIVITNLIKVYDYYIGIPITNFGMLQIYLILMVITLFIALYLYVKSNKKNFTKDNR